MTGAGRLGELSRAVISTSAPLRAQPFPGKQEGQQSAMGRYSGEARLVLMCIVSMLLFVMELVISPRRQLPLDLRCFCGPVPFLVSMVVGSLASGPAVCTAAPEEHVWLSPGRRSGRIWQFRCQALMFSIPGSVKGILIRRRQRGRLLVLSAESSGLLFNILNYAIFLTVVTARGPRAPGRRRNR